MKNFGRASRNVFANLTGAASSAILSLVFNFSYYHMLGQEAYGLITSFLTLATLAGVFDFGVSRTTFRELARSTTSEELAITSRSVVMTLQLLQWCIFLALGAAIIGFSPFLADWLNARSLSHRTIVTCIALSGVCIAFAQPRMMYRSGLSGLGYQITSNTLKTGFAAFTGLATLGVLELHGPSIVAFFMVQLVGFAAESLLTGLALWRVLPSGRLAPRLSILNDVKDFASVDGAGSIMTTILTTSDRIILSRVAPLGEFGQYGLITLVCLTLSLVTGPFTNAYFHEFTVAWQKHDYRWLSQQYQDVSEVVNSIAIAVGLVLALFSFEIMTLLTSSRIVAEQIALPTRLFALGSVLWSLQFMPHTLTLAAGWPALWLLVSSLTALAYIPLLWILTPIWGLLAPTALWFAANLIMFPLLTHLMHRRLLPDVEIAWLKRTVVKPAIICAVVLLATRAALQPAGSLIGIVGELTFVVIVTGLVLLFINASIRMWALLAAEHVLKLAKTITFR